MSAVAIHPWQEYLLSRGDPRARSGAGAAILDEAQVAFAFTPLDAAPRGDAAELPERVLRFAEFLFYRGIVTWGQVTDALRWQRAQRPTVGELAVAHGWLTPEQVEELLDLRCRERAFDVPFCAFAERKGRLSPEQRATIVAEQRRRHRPIGAYFVERGLLAEEEAQALSFELRRHNARCRRRAAERADGAGGAPPGRRPRGSR